MNKGKNIQVDMNISRPDGKTITEADVDKFTDLFITAVELKGCICGGTIQLNKDDA